MLKLALVLLLCFLCALICGAFWLTGFFIGTKGIYIRKEKKPEMTENEIIERKRQEKAMKSFLEYTGYEQSE